MGIPNREQLEHTQRQIAKLELALEEMKRDESPRAHESYVTRVHCSDRADAQGD